MMLMAKQKIEYRIVSDTDSNLMFSKIGSYINGVFNIYKGLINPLEIRGYRELKVRRNNDVWWLTFTTDMI